MTWGSSGIVFFGPAGSFAKARGQSRTMSPSLRRPQRPQGFSTQVRRGSPAVGAACINVGQMTGLQCVFVAIQEVLLMAKAMAKAMAYVGRRSFGMVCVCVLSLTFEIHNES